MKLVMAFGTFDIFHKGHEHYLKYAKSLGDVLTVVISRDDNIKKIKGKEPLNNEKDRYKVVSEKKYVDEVLFGHKEDLFRIIIEEKPDIICLGYDHWIDEKKLRASLEKRDFKDFKIKTAKAYKPEKYKSSLLKKSTE